MFKQTIYSKKTNQIGQFFTFYLCSFFIYLPKQNTHRLNSFICFLSLVFDKARSNSIAHVQSRHVDLTTNALFELLGCCCIVVIMMMKL